VSNNIYNHIQSRLIGTDIQIRTVILSWRIYIPQNPVTSLTLIITLFLPTEILKFKNFFSSLNVVYIFNYHIIVLCYKCRITRLYLQIHYPKEVLDEWQQRPQKLVCRYIKKYLSKRGLILNNHCGSVNVKSPRRFKLVQQESESYD